MEYYALLTVATTIIVILALALYRKSGDLGVLVGTAALYYWSLFGAWYIVLDKSGGYSGKFYHYLEYKMFEVNLDSNYMAALACYAAFVILAQLALLLALPSRKTREREVPKLLMRHGPILVIAAIAGAGSVFLIEDKISTAWALNTSAYYYTRTQTDQWFTLHQVLNRVAMIPPSIGFATYLAGNRSRYFVNVARRYTLAGYIVVLAGMGGFTFILGNKNEVFVSLLTGFLCYLASVRRPSLWKVGLTITAGLWFLYAIDFFRSVPISAMETAITQRIDEATEVGRFLTSSNEAYAAHFSMYGVLANHVEPKFGYSFYSLACSIVPRLFWPDRPEDIYNYYTESVGSIGGQGYSLHHATGWYLNFGYPGVALGGIALGLAWAYCLRARARIGAHSGLLFRLFAVVSPWLFVACLPPLVRAGPEAYKGLILESVLIPVGTLLFACRPKKSSRPLVLYREVPFREPSLCEQNVEAVR
jgi:hypothetical protein